MVKLLDESQLENVAVRTTTLGTEPHNDDQKNIHLI